MLIAPSNGFIFNALVLKNLQTELGFAQIAEPRGAKDCLRYNKINHLPYIFLVESVPSRTK
jgi:hypothetical protein